MRSFRAGRDLYAIGSNPDAAELAGVPAGRRVFTAFVISGALAGFAGALFLAEFATVGSTTRRRGLRALRRSRPSSSAGWRSSAAAARCSALRSAPLLLNTINQALVASRISAFWNQAIAGALLLAAIAFDRWLACG